MLLKNRRLVGLSWVKTQVSVAINFAGVKTACYIGFENLRMKPFGKIFTLSSIVLSSKKAYFCK